MVDKRPLRFVKPLPNLLVVEEPGAPLLVNDLIAGPLSEPLPDIQRDLPVAGYGQPGSQRGVVPIELKSGQAPKEGAWDNHKIQLAAYALLLESIFKISIDAGYVKYIDDGISRRIEINAFLKDQVKDLVKEVNTMLSSRVLPKKCTNTNKCEKCGLKKICYSDEITEKAKDLNRIAPLQNTSKESL